jgi:hypothetical protein
MKRKMGQLLYLTNLKRTDYGKKVTKVLSQDLDPVGTGTKLVNFTDLATYCFPRLVALVRLVLCKCAVLF